MMVATIQLDVYELALAEACAALWVPPLATLSLKELHILNTSSQKTHYVLQIWV